MTRNDHRTQFNQLLNRLNERFVGQVYKALRLQINAFTHDLKTYGHNIAMSRLNFSVLNEHIAPPILAIHKSAGVFMAQKTLSELRNHYVYHKSYVFLPHSEGGGQFDQTLQLKRRPFGYNEEWVRDIQNYFSNYLLNKSVIPISETTRDRILEVMNKAIEEGWGVDETVARLTDIPEIRGRAQRIVRTETVRAANYGILLGADKYDYEVIGEWLSVHDHRTRHSHILVDGQKRELGQPFSNGLMFPGDPNAPAREVVNCRCRLVVVPQRDSRGRLIPKKSPTRVASGGSLIDIFGGISAGLTIGDLIGEINE